MDMEYIMILFANLAQENKKEDSLVLIEQIDIFDF